LVAVGIYSTLVYAEEDTRFDNIVSELKSSLQQETQPIRVVDDPFDSVQMQMGAAVSAGVVNLGTNGSPSGSAMLKGFDVHFGIDLFSSYWAAEGCFRSFGTEDFATHYAASLREFDLKVVHKNDLQSKVKLRMGAGLSARYLTVMDSRNGQYHERTDKTPAFIALIGVDRQLSPVISIGPDISYRSPLIRETSEKASADASLRLNVYF
jgi:hypothetical protein